MILPLHPPPTPRKGQKVTLLFASGFNLSSSRRRPKLLQHLGSLFFVVKVSGSRRFSEVWGFFLICWWECIDRGFRTETANLTLLSIRYFFTIGINIYWCFLREAQKWNKKSAIYTFAVTMQINLYIAHLVPLKRFKQTMSRIHSI